jgi:hypothetical protein
MPSCPTRPSLPTTACASLVLLWGSLTATGDAQAQTSARFMSAGELHQRLSASEPEAREAGRHYVLGVIDALALVRDPRTCLGPGVGASQLIDAVAGQLRARPDLHRANAASFVREAVATAFPCV